MLGCEVRGDVEEDDLAAFEAACVQRAVVPFRALKDVPTVSAAAALITVDYDVGKKKTSAGSSSGSGGDRSATRGFFNVFKQASANVGIFGLADDGAGEDDDGEASA